MYIDLQYFTMVPRKSAENRKNGWKGCCLEIISSITI